MCFCCVCFRFSVLSQEIGWEECLQNDLFLCWVGRKTLTQSIPLGFLPLFVLEESLQISDTGFLQTGCPSCH